VAEKKKARQAIGRSGSGVHPLDLFHNPLGRKIMIKQTGRLAR
jgi:hypothetical protein